MINAALTIFCATMVPARAIAAPATSAIASVDAAACAKYLDGGVLECLRNATGALSLQSAIGIGPPNGQTKLAANNSSNKPEANGKAFVPSICKETDVANEVVQGFVSCLAMQANDNKFATAKLVVDEIKQTVCSKVAGLRSEEQWGYLQERLKNDSMLRKRIADIYVQVGEFQYSMEAIKQMTAGKPANGCFANNMNGWIPDADSSSFHLNRARIALMTQAYEKLFAASGYVLEKENSTLGRGKFGIAFKVHKACQANSTKYAMKIARCGTLKNEHEAMTDLQHLSFIPRVYGPIGISTDGWWDFFVMELVGKSIHSARKEGLVWAEEYNQLIRLAWHQVSLLHGANSTKCYTHGDLHAANFAVDSGAFGHQRLYIMDYGMSVACSKEKISLPVLWDYVHLAMEVRDGAPKYGSAINGTTILDAVLQARPACLAENSSVSIKDCLVRFEPRVAEEFKRAGAGLAENKPLWLPAAKINEEKARLSTRQNQPQAGKQ